MVQFAGDWASERNRTNGLIEYDPLGPLPVWRTEPNFSIWSEFSRNLIMPHLNLYTKHRLRKVGAVALVSGLNRKRT